MPAARKNPTSPEASTRGTRSASAAPREPSLAQLIRRSPALDAVSRRQWLAVLPHLTPEDRERLRAILLEAAADSPASQP